MKKWSLALALVVLLMILSTLLSARFFVQPWLARELPAQAKAHAAMDLQFAALSLHLLPRPVLTLKEVTIDHAMVHGTIRSVLIQVHPLQYFTRGALAVAVDLDQPQLKVTPTKTTENPKASPPPSGPAVPAQAPMPMQWHFHIADGAIEIDGTAQLKELELMAAGLDVRGPFAIDLKAQALAYGLTLPVSLCSGWQRQGSVFTTEKTELTLAGLRSLLQGQMDTATGDQSWKLRCEIADLNSLPRPIPEVEHWQGALLAEAQAQKAHDTWAAQGSVDAKSVQLKANYRRGDAELQGPIEIAGHTRFSWQQQALQMPELNLNTSLRQASIRYQKMFSKPPGTDLHLQVDGGWSGTELILRQAELVLGGLRASAQGGLNPQGSSTLHIQIPTTNLKGLEALSPLLSHSPLSGELAVAADLRGPLNDFQKLQINVNNLKLNKAHASVRYNENSKDPKAFKVVGDLSAQLAAQAQLVGLRLLRASVKGFVDGAGLDMVYSDLWRKPKGALFAVNVDGQGSPDRLTVRALSLKSSEGSASLSGELQYTYVAQKSLLEMPAAFRGQFHGHLKKLAYKTSESAKPAPPPPSAGASSPKPQSLLPNWPILRRSTLNHELSIDTVFFKDLKIDGVRWQGVLDRGMLSGKAHVDQLFSGQVDASAVAMNLVEPQPRTHVQAKWRGLHLQNAVDWALPSWKDQVQGTATGDVKSEIPFPGSPGWVDGIVASGQIDISRGRISSMRFEKLAQEQLAKVPALGAREVHFDDVLADISSRYQLQKSQLALQGFHMKSPNNDELFADGSLNLNQEVDLHGTAYLNNAPVSGSIRAANSDKQGRLVLPLQIRGRITQPQVSFAAETINKLLSNTVKYEGDKLKNKLQEHSGELLDKAKDQLKDFFGK